MEVLNGIEKYWDISQEMEIEHSVGIDDFRK